MRSKTLLPVSLFLMMAIISRSTITPETYLIRVTDTESGKVYFTQSLQAHWRGQAGSFLTAEGTVTFTPSQEHRGKKAPVGSNDSWRIPFCDPGTKATYEGTVSGNAAITAEGVQKHVPVYGQGYDFATFRDIQSGKREKITRFSADEMKAADIPGFEINKAARDDDLGKVKALLKGNPDLVFTKYDKYGATPLHVAAEKGHKEVADLLLANKAEVNAKITTGATPLHMAAFSGRKELVELLLANKAEVDTKANDGWTPLHVAAEKGHKEVVELLLANKAEVNAQTNDGWTPLHVAAQKGRKEVAELLLANQAEVNAKANNGLTPLHVSLAQGHKGLVELLLANKAEVNAKITTGATPLHMAAFSGHKEVVELLLANKATVNVKANDGSTPLHVSLAQGHKEMAKLLR